MIVGKKFQFPLDHWKDFVGTDPNVVVVGVIGKTNFSARINKADCFNSYFQYDIFGPGQNETGVRGYFCPAKKLIFLEATGTYDANALVKTLESIKDELKEKGFLSVWTELREDSTKLFLFLFLVSHIVVVFNDSAHFDLNYLQLFKIIESFRTKIQSSMSDILKTVPGLPKDWLTMGRLCSPRVLFYFDKLPPACKEGDTRNYQHLVEDKIYRILRKCRIITNNSAQSLFAVPMNQEFVFVRRNSSQRLRRLNFLLSFLDADPDIPAEQNEFAHFLNQHVELAKTKGFSDNLGRHYGPSIFVVPPASTWFEVSSKLYRFFTMEHPSDSKAAQGVQFLRSVLDVEGSLSEARCSKVLPLALAVYQENLPAHYNSEYHSMKKSQAVALLSTHARGPAVAKFVAKLEKECDRIWQRGRRMCEEPSLSGNPCIQPIHNAYEEEVVDPKLPTLPHLSGVRHVTACNCGRRQANREDPYDVKYANYDFYRKLEEDCCGRLSHGTFPVFQASTVTVRAADIGKQKAKPESSAKGDETKEVDKLVQAAELLSLGPEENEFMSSEEAHLSPPREAEASQISLGNVESAVPNVIDVLETSGSSEETQKVSTTEYLPFMPHLGCPSGYLPRYASWSLVCLGPSSLYSHNAGLGDQPGFLTGSGFLLPWDVTVRVQQAESSSDGKRSSQTVFHGKGRRGKASQEFTVKIFVGVEYECPRGHRFMSSSPGRVLKATGAGLVKDSAQLITSSDMPLYMQCPCPYSRGSKALVAQLMRIHIVTPKAPVHVTLDPRVRPASLPCPIFTSGSIEPLRLTQSAYWILRFPYLYEDENKIYLPPKEGAHAAQQGFLLKGTFNVNKI